MWNKVDDAAHGEIKRKEVAVDDGLMPVCGVRVRAWTATTSNLRDASCDEPSCDGRDIVLVDGRRRNASSCGEVQELALVRRVLAPTIEQLPYFGTCEAESDLTSPFQDATETRSGEELWGLLLLNSDWRE